MPTIRVCMTFAACLAMIVLAIGGCASKKQGAGDAPPPPPIFTGPAVFHGTVGSMAKIPYEDLEPMLVSGFGLVTHLADTGSSEVPSHLYQRFLNMVRQRGFGSARLDTQNMPPRLVLESLTTAVVTVEGFIPPGATRGSRFDVFVRAVPGTQTTSLEGGRLYTTEMSPMGIDPTVPTTRIEATSSGPCYLNPFEDSKEAAERKELSRQAVVLSGGRSTFARRLRLVLNQPHWRRSQLIADRINEVFRRDYGEREETAAAQDDSFIELHIPSRWHSDPERFLQLVLHLYVQRMDDFEVQQARQLGGMVTQNPEYAGRTALAWEALGRTALPAIAEWYNAPNVDIRFAALSAGARLGDEKTSEHLAVLAEDADPLIRKRAANEMVHLPDSIRVEKTLRRLLDDPDRSVRIAAYLALDMHGDAQFIQRTVVKDSDDKQIKFLLDVVDSQKAMIFVTQTNLPRVVVFNGFTGFKTPMVASVWDHRLMIKAPALDKPASVYFQPLGKADGTVIEIAPALANLVLLLSREPEGRDMSKGLGLTYSQVVNAIYQLVQRDQIRAEFELEASPLAKLVAEARNASPTQERPETGPAPAEPAEKGVPGATKEPSASAR